MTPWAWLTAILWSLQATMIRAVVRAAAPADVFALAGAIAGLGAAAVMAVRLLRGQALWSMTMADTSLLAGAEVLGVLGLASFFVAVRAAGVGPAAAVSAAYPVGAALLAWVLLGEPPTPLQMVGLVVAGVGIALVQHGT